MRVNLSFLVGANDLKSKPFPEELKHINFLTLKHNFLNPSSGFSWIDSKILENFGELTVTGNFYENAEEIKGKGSNRRVASVRNEADLGAKAVIRNHRLPKVMDSLLLNNSISIIIDLELITLMQ